MSVEISCNSKSKVNQNRQGKVDVYDIKKEVEVRGRKKIHHRQRYHSVCIKKNKKGKEYLLPERKKKRPLLDPGPECVRYDWAEFMIA